MRTRRLLITLASCYATLGQQGDCVAEDNGKYYDLNPLKSKTDYKATSESGLEFTLNVCTAVTTETWQMANPATVEAFYRGPHSDISIGNVNTTIVIKDSHPLLLLSGGTPCGGESSALKASSAIRFICDNDVFGTGQPKFIAQFPPDDESACGFVFEWRTHVACPTAKAGSGVIEIVAAVALVLLLTYIVAGVVYRRLVLGYRGLDQFPRFSLIPISSLPHYWSEFVDWISDLRDHFRGGVRDLWPRSRATSGGTHPTRWRSRSDGFSPLAREEEEAMFRDGPDGPDARFSLEEEDIGSAQELVDPAPPPPAKTNGDEHNGGAIRL
ncbi:mannose-6-phosphate receptor binding domain-containing protein [Hysterangium stoloniferum]|nr:mannose-6-phosphate receptor binding domain-containing protein [Hysterangium stoloniferum]